MDLGEEIGYLKCEKSWNMEIWKFQNWNPKILQIFQISFFVNFPKSKIINHSNRKIHLSFKNDENQNFGLDHPWRFWYFLSRSFSAFNFEICCLIRFIFVSACSFWNFNRVISYFRSMILFRSLRSLSRDLSSFWFKSAKRRPLFLVLPYIWFGWEF